MEAKRLVLALLRAASHSPDLDREIAFAVGYKMRSGARPGEEFWTSPAGVEVMKLPSFTLNLHDSIALAETLSLESGGISWEDGAGSAKIGAHRTMQARTPSLALCAAIIYTLLPSETYAN